MSIVPRSNDPVPYETGFPDPDPYGLGHKGKRLSNVFKDAEDPLVIAVDGPWGSGKSYFLKGWSKDHGLDAQVIYFDAFKHDYLDDPLISLVQAIAERLPSSAKSTFLSVAKKAAPILGKALVRAATVGAVKELDEIGDIFAEEVGGEAQKALDNLWSVETCRHKAMETFSTALETLVADKDTPNKLIFIVDELDRCRPDYALQMLEVMKHFFAVPNVHFVLGANIEQLQNSVHARYGAGIAADKYLQRFIHATMDVQYSIARNCKKRHVHEISFFGKLDNREEFPIISEILQAIPVGEKITFRDMERLYTLSRLTNPSISNQLRIFIDGLLVIKACRPEWIIGLSSGGINAEKVSRFFDLRRQVEVEKAGSSVVWGNFGILWSKALDLVEIDDVPEDLKQLFTPPISNVRYGLLAELISAHLNGFEVR